MRSRKVPSPLRGEDKGEGVFQDEIKVVGQAWQSLLDKNLEVRSSKLDLSCGKFLEFELRASNSERRYELRQR